MTKETSMLLELITQHIESDRIDHKRIERGLEGIEKKLTTLSIDVASLKVKAGVWGAMAGLLPVLGAVLLGLLT